MKRILMALAVAALATAGKAHADPGGYAPPGGRNAGMQLPQLSAPPSGGSENTLVGAVTAPPTRPPERYGLLPGLRKVFRLGGSSSCSTCGVPGQGGAGYGPGGYDAANQYPPVQQGTLVFPNHPYVRSPRDFFMYEPGR